MPWRESGAEPVEIPEAPQGGPDMDALERALVNAKGAELVIGAFSAASNVTGILTQVDEVTRLLKRHGALAIWDYGGGAQILTELGVQDMILLTNTHHTLVGLEGYGLSIVGERAIPGTGGE